MARTPEIDKAYMSPIDKFLKKFNQTHALSKSQRQEKAKHDKIMKKRDKS